MFVFVVWVFSYHKLVAKPQKTLHVPSKGSAVHSVEARHRDRKAFLPESFGRAGGRAGAWAGGRSGLETRPRVTPASLVVGFKTEPRFKRRGDMQIPSLFLFPLFRFVPALLLRFAIVRSTINPFFSFPSVRKIALDNPLSIIDILSENSFSFFSFLNDVFLLRYFCPSTLKMNDECEKY